METRPKRRVVSRLLIGLVSSLVLFLVGYSYLFGPVDKYGQTSDFYVEPDTSIEGVAHKLVEEGFARSEFAFEAAYMRASNGRDIRPGGYRISSSMDVWSVASVLAQRPYFSSIRIKPGMRKEQIADLLVEYLDWTPEEREQWLTIYTAPAPSFVEGVYYPDTYLLPSDMAPKDVADRMRSRFQEVFAPYANEATEKGMEWTDVVTLASLVEREAAKNDKTLVAGILWNRLDRNMLLQVDATLQYIRGSEEAGWWPQPRSEDKYLDSPFNTYKHVGLPPHPIANPSLDSIRAVIDSAPTDCLYYLHDPDGQIHCSTSYKGQVRNVNRYLK